MAGGYYTALSGMRARLDALDRLASDIANASTAGYKTERNGTQQAPRPSFGDTLQSAIDVTSGEPRIDFRPARWRTTGRSLDVAIEGRGFFVVETPQGPRYTRNGHLQRSADGVLATTKAIRFSAPTARSSRTRRRRDRSGRHGPRGRPDRRHAEGRRLSGRRRTSRAAAGRRFSAERPPTPIERPSIAARHARAVERVGRRAHRRADARSRATSDAAARRVSC